MCLMAMTAKLTRISHRHRILVVSSCLQGVTQLFVIWVMTTSTFATIFINVNYVRVANVVITSNQKRRYNANAVE